MSGHLREFLRACGGNVAMMFGLFLIPLLIGAGIALDMVRANYTRSTVEQAADAGLLAAARARLNDKTLSDASATAIARRQFDANAKLSGDATINDFVFSYDKAHDKFELEVNGAVKTTLLSVTGRRVIPINVVSEAKVAPPRALEAVMVLDVTNSMKGDKLAALKDAARDLVDTVMPDTGDSVKFGVVPFSQYVNIGVSRRGAPWLSVPADYSVTNYSCRNTYPDAKKSNCRTVARTCMNDGVPYDCSSEVCDWDYGEAVEVCGDRTSTYKWRGCVGSRNYPLNVQDGDYNSNPVPGLLNIYCPAEVLPLTSVKAQVKSKISALAVQGDTYIPSGLAWGWRLVSSTDPFSEGQSYESFEVESGIKSIILMTDGANTRSPAYPSHAGTNATLANSLTRDLCDNIKAKKIVVYTIAFEVTDSTILDLLRGCATDPANFYDASDSAKLADAFEAIGDQLQRLALSK